LLLTFLLRRRGWEVVYLGANVPVEQLETTVSATKPDLVVMAAQQLHTAATLRDVALALQEQGVPLAYGGLVFNLVPALRERIPGHFLGEGIEAAPQVVESLLTSPRPVPSQQALASFQEHKGMIESRMIRTLSGAAYAPTHLAVGNQRLGRSIGAALALGDMAYLGTDIAWVRGLLDFHQEPSAALDEFLRAYHRAAEEQLDERGKPITDWLGALASSQSGQ
jgi:hypothetical protein